MLDTIQLAARFEVKLIFAKGGTEDDRPVSFGVIDASMREFSVRGCR